MSSFGVTSCADSGGDGWDEIMNDNRIQNCYVTTDEFSVKNSNTGAPDHTMSVSTSVGVWNCAWNPTDKTWDYKYKITGMGICSDERPLISSAHIVVESSDSENIRLDGMEDSEYTWSTPSSNSDNVDKAGQILVIGIDIILSIIPGADVLGTIWGTANDVISLMRNDSGSLSSGDNIRHYTWDWTPLAEDVCQQLSIVAKLSARADESITIDYYTKDFHGDERSPGKFKFTMSAPETEGYPNTLTPEERESAGITTVPRSDLISSADKYNLTSADVMTLLLSGEEEFYFANSAPKCEILPSTHQGCPENDQTIVYNSPESPIDDIYTYPQICTSDKSSSVGTRIKNETGELNSIQAPQRQKTVLAISNYYELKTMATRYVPLISQNVEIQMATEIKGFGG